MKIVSNEFPSIALDYRLAVIADGPGPEEEYLNRPCVGPGGKIVSAVMQALKIPRSACFIGHVTQMRAPMDMPDKLSVDNQDVLNGMMQLREDLARFNPHCCLLMGDLSLKAAGIGHSALDFRGTIFESREMSGPFLGRKCVGTVSPNSLTVGRSPENIPLFKFDVKRAHEESFTSRLDLPVRTAEVDLNCSQLEDRLNAIKQGDIVAMDIEGGVTQGITCISFAPTPHYAFNVNWLDFSEDEKIRLLRAVGRVLCDEKIFKVLQNSLYDNFVLSYVLKMPIRGVIHDTMLAGWERFPELPKSLGVQASINTREPFYKFERKVNDKRTHYIYCCKDSMVTREIADVHMKHLKGRALEHFNFNMALLPALNYMELKGFLYDHDGAKEQLSLTKTKMSEIESRMEVIAGRKISPNTNNGANSLSNVLYKQLGFEPQYKKVNGRKTTSTTADVEALLRLVKTDGSQLIYHILQWRLLEGVRKQLEISPDADGRIRCGYNLVGTETGRMTCYESPSGSGMNLTTVTKKLRWLYQADPGKVIIKCDLEGADGWTVAAHCDRLGDPTMIQDYYAHIKPARVIAAMKQDHNTAHMEREELGRYIKAMDIPEWLYFACKRVQHGSNYGLGKITMSTVILRDSWKVDGNPIYMTPADCHALQRLYLEHRYTGVTKWQNWITKELFDKRSLSCASGHVRTFFGHLGHPDRPDPKTKQSGLSHEPQANTTYAVNHVLYNLWHDPDNYDTRGCLLVEPLHQVHDEVVMQVDESRVEWAVEKVRSWFNNEMIIADHKIIIPFDGGYGPSWGETPNKIHT